jgi:hypothetical protein
VRDEWFRQIIIAQIVMRPSFHVFVVLISASLFADERRHPLDAAQSIQPAEQRCPGTIATAERSRSVSRCSPVNSRARTWSSFFADDQQARREAQEDAEAEAAAAAEAEAQNFWPCEAAVASVVNSARPHRNSTSGADASSEAASALGQLRLSDSHSTSASQSGGKIVAGAGVSGTSHQRDDGGNDDDVADVDDGDEEDDDDDDDETPPPFDPSEDWT